jgi:hypothetical protein
MCTHFKIFRSQWGKCFRRLSVLIVGLMVVSLCYGQYHPVQVIFSIQPPYSPEIYKDYQQLSATLISTEPVECFVRISLEGDNGISIFTEPGFKPMVPITLVPNHPYVLNSENWQEAVNLDHITIQGITEAELIQNGMLPGNYSFCLLVLDYMSGQPISEPAPAGCASFTISSLSPPSFIDCRESMSFPTPQFTNPVMWMTDPATPASAYYILRGKQVPLGMTAEQAWNLESVPLAFERIVKDKIYMLSGMDLGDISIGNQYVIAVQVVDPKNTVTIQNDGWSEICSFLITPDGLISPPIVIDTGVIHPPATSWPPDTHIKNVSYPPPHYEKVSCPSHWEGVTFPPQHYKNVTFPNHIKDVTWPPYHVEKSTYPPHTKDVTFPPEHFKGVTFPAHVKNGTFPPYHVERSTYPPHTKDVSFPPEHFKGVSNPTHVKEGTWPPYHVKRQTPAPHAKGVTFPPHHFDNVTNPPHVKDGTFPPAHAKRVTFPTIHAKDSTFPTHKEKVSFPPFHIKDYSWPTHVTGKTWPPKKN